MTNNTDTKLTDESIDYCGLSYAERNRYFHGKLMTARDMAAEQAYHRRQRTGATRHVTGYGVVDGLDATVRDTDRGLELTITPGYAIDCCGRPVVVPNETTEVIDSAETREHDRLALFLAYAECVTESVPVPGSEDACERECAYNRVVESFSVRVEPVPGRGKPVPPVEFPDKRDLAEEDTDVSPPTEYREARLEQSVASATVTHLAELKPTTGFFTTDGGDLDPYHPALTKIARSFDEVEERDGMTPLGCTDDGDHAIYLGEFVVPDDGGSSEVEGIDRARVYSNDMLYAAIARHTADFANPHDVVGTLNGLTGDPQLVSEDDSVTITVDGDTGEIDLVADTAGSARRLKALECGMTAFGEVARTFDSEPATDLERAYREAIDSEEVAADAEHFIEFMRGEMEVAILERHRAVTDEFERHIGGQDNYNDRVDALEAAIDDGDADRTAIEQVLVCEAARSFTGTTIDITRFFPNHDVGRPLTIDSVIFDSPDGFALVDQNRMRLMEARAEEEDPDELEAELTMVMAEETGREAFFGTATEELTDLTGTISDEMVVIEQPEVELPRAYLAFQQLWVDLPETTYVEGDLVTMKYPITIDAFDRESNLVGSDEIPMGGGTFSIAADEGIDRLVLAAEHGSGELAELRFSS